MTTDDVFAPLADPQSYRNVAFLLTSFPLGTGYFLYVLLGLSLGAGLSVFGVGVLLLIGTLVSLQWLAAFERWRVRVMLGRSIETPAGPPEHERFLDRLRALVGAATTWRTVGYVVFVFGFGVAGFTLSAVGLVGGTALVSAPLTYDTPSVGFQFGVWEPASLLDGLALVPVGVLVLLVATHACNRLARVGESMAVELLGPDER